MRFATVSAMMALVMVVFSRPAIPDDVTVVQNGQTFYGWTNSWGKIVIVDRRGKTIMRGRLNRMGSVDIIAEATGESFVGRVNPMGYGRLISAQTGESLRIEVER